MARIAHVSPLDLERMKLRDFFQLILDIDAFAEANKDPGE